MFSPAGVTIDLAIGTSEGGEGGIEISLSPIEDIDGSHHDDILSGGQADNVSTGRGQRSSPWAVAGPIILSGGAGQRHARRRKWRRHAGRREWRRLVRGQSLVTKQITILDFELGVDVLDLRGFWPLR